jgi:ubiquinone/menaquinone biosynthesis C-methylase UbiE
MSHGRIGYEDIPEPAASAAAQSWWDANAAEYLEENGDFLGDAEFVWGPEGLRESQAQLLGPTDRLVGKQILEIGSGAGQCSRWLARHGARVVASDLSHAMLVAGRQIDETAGMRVPVVQCDARTLPFADRSFDAAFTSFGAIPFVPDARRIHAEIFRVLAPGGRWVCSVTHPARWMFPDDPTRHGTTITRSYFARDPYVEFDAAGRVEYAEYHRTLGDHVRDIAASGLRIVDVVEPEWPHENTNVWGGWGPERGALLPGTAIFVCDKPA